MTVLAWIHSGVVYEYYASAQGGPLLRYVKSRLFRRGISYDYRALSKGVHEPADVLGPEERGLVLERLKLARQFLVTRVFLSWKTPLERNKPLAMRPEPADPEKDEKSAT